MRATIVLDLGFGDAGKGLLTDWLVRRRGAGLVVRFNGGAQAGHNVVTPGGRHHTFAQFGAGSFVAGVRTFLARPVVVHPTALLREGEALAARGVADPFSRLAVSEEARIITPFQQAVGRLRELARGAACHGTCGVGVGETVGDALARPGEAVVARDLADPGLLAAKARRIRERKRREVAVFAGSLPDDGPAGLAARRELEILESDAALAVWVEEASRFAGLGVVQPDSMLPRWMEEAGEVVFEGAQGVLLDESRGFHPYTTWSDATARNALEILAAAAPEVEIERLGVLRAYAVRHGPGPLPTETEELAAAVSEHNHGGGWQGAVRYGWFDAVLARYALEVAGPLDALAVTHLDVVPRLSAWRLATAYRWPEAGSTGGLVAETTAEGHVPRLAVPAETDLARQERLTALVGAAEPVYQDCVPVEEAVLEEIEAALGRPVDLVSRGPTALDVARRGRAPHTAGRV